MHVDTPGHTAHAFFCARDEKKYPLLSEWLHYSEKKKKGPKIILCIICIDKVINHFRTSTAVGATIY